MTEIARPALALMLVLQALCAPSTAGASALDELRAAAEAPGQAFDGVAPRGQQAFNDGSGRALAARASLGPKWSPFDEGIDRAACGKKDPVWLCVGKVLGTPVLAPAFSSGYGAAWGWRKGANAFTKTVYAGAMGLLGLFYGITLAPIVLFVQIATLIAGAVGAI